VTGKERVLATVERRPVDRVPVYHSSFSGHAARVILGREALVGGGFVRWRAIQALWEGPDAYDAYLSQCEADALAVARACGHDVLRPSYWNWGGGRPAAKLAENEFLFRPPDGHEYTMVYHPETELLTRRNGTGAGASDSLPSRESLARQVEQAESEAAQPASADAPVTDTPSLHEKYPDYIVKAGFGTPQVNVQNTASLTAAALWPELTRRLLVARARKTAKKIPRLARQGLLLSFGGGDFCSNKGPVISPAMFREVVLPGLRILTDTCHKHGIRYLYATDGNVWPVADELFVAGGVDGFFEIDRRAGMDLRKLRARYPHLTLFGNISVHTLHRGTQEAVRRETMDCLETAKALGGIVIGASNLIMPGTPPENILTMLETIRDNR